MIAGLLAAAAPPAAAAEEDDRPTYRGKTFYTGEFHAHTSVSDGVEMPPDAFEHVHDETDADFFTVSEHDVMWDLRNGDDFVDDWRDADSREWRAVHEEVETYNASQDDLVAVPSIENTWYDGTGHINVFNTDWKATARATEKGSVDGFANSFGTGDLKYDLATFYARLKLDPDAIAQFNHPSTTSKGNFFGFTGLDPVTDDRMELIEVKSAGHLAQYEKALDAGWHVGPVWNGDEHSASWVSGNDAITGLWASDHSLDGLYGAMKDRSVFSTQDVDTVLEFGAGDVLMGSVLPADTTTTTFDIRLTDADADDVFTSVELVTNGGTVAKQFDDVSGHEVSLSLERDVADGDYYFVRAGQADGDVVVSAPVWVGETTRGANYAPEITVPDGFVETAVYGEEVALPEATATDDSGTTPTVTYEVYDAAGEVPVADGAFRVRSYDPHYVVVKATDDAGSTNAELLRITVDQDALDPAGVFQYFGSTAAVTEKPGGAGIAVSTDRSIETVYAQVREAGTEGWDDADVLTSTNDRPYEVNTIGNDEETYQHSITGQTLRSHEFDVAGLDTDGRYEYRFGVARDGGAPDPDDDAAWTDVEGELVAGGADDEPIYVIGDLQATSHDADDLGMLRDVLDRLETEAPGGRTLVQTGDLVDNGGRGQYWDEVFEHVFEGLDVQVAPVAGNHETYGDLDYDSTTTERTAIFSNLYDLPKNGAIGESNYSFDRGDVHVSVLNSVKDMDAQLAWLTDDIRSSTRTWNVVVGHYSYYGGQHGDDADLAGDRPKITAALDRLGVDLYVGGHDHLYKRSTIYDGRLAQTPEEEALGTTYVTMGSAGPKFYENTVHWWDDVVFDEDTQVGGVLEVTDEGLKIATYTVDGREVDSYTVRKPRGTWKVTSTDVVDRRLDGVGLLSYPGSRDDVTVVAATYDSSGRQMGAMRSVDATLDHRGVEQFVTFDEPLPVAPSDTLRVYLWDGLESAQPIRPAITVREGIAGDGTADDPYLIASAADLAKIANDPAKHYRLTTDLDLSGTTTDQIDRLVSFRGVLDGDGHTISGFTAPSNQGVGLFADNQGTIRNLVVRGDVESAKTTIGLLADVNHGTIEQVRTEGSITGAGRVGGIVGDHYGVVRDSYSTADVRATGLYSGGVVGIAIGGSVTENAYASGAVTADGRNAGGVVSYGYDETVVHHVVALNAQVVAPTWAHAIVGRVGAGQVADLLDNHVSDAVAISGESLTDEPAADNPKGAVVAAAQARTQAFFVARGWDFDTVWAWDEDGKRPVLQNAFEDVPPLPEEPEAPALEQADDGAYLITKPADLEEVAAWPDESFRLTSDLDLDGVTLPQLGFPAPFTGELDGAGHVLRGFTSTSGGLFGTIDAGASVHDLELVDATVTKSASKAGILVDSLRGTVERVSVGGSVSSLSYAGGVAGDSFGTIRDVYSTAEVSTTGGNYAGGIIGVADSPSTTERVYATGAVTASGTTAGGLTGYARDSGTVVRDSIALNPSVTATSLAHRVVARYASGQTATLSNNLAIETLVAQTQSVTATGPTTLNGETVTTAETQSADTWTGRLGWDLDSVWRWDDEAQRPVLRRADEPADGRAQRSSAAVERGAVTVEPVSYALRHPAPSVVGQAEDGSAMAHDAVLADGVATVTLHGGAAAAGGQVGVLVLDGDADADAPGAGDVAYVGQAAADDAGDATFEVALAQGSALEAYRLVAGTSAGTPRYVASLDPDERPAPEKATTSTSAQVRPWAVAYGRSAVVTARVTSPAGHPTGRVEVRKGSRVLGSTSARRGVTTVRVPARSLAPGRHTLTVRYRGDERHRASSDTVRLRITKARSRITAAKVKPRKVVAERTRVKVVVRVRGAHGVRPRGLVTVRGRGVDATARVRHGVAKVRLGRLPRAGRQRFTVTYRGSDQLSSSTRTVKVRVRRR
ncbi:Ig-like domain repeat protein [Mumia flava]|uniref:Ig-like domain repeat protein n=1 Tax=Mumia flava TaxID=1348852 RepID=UPI00058085E6|nr:Ig-like domain repeat protein [Mumia flava]